MSEQMPHIISQIEIAKEEINQILLDTKAQIEENTQEATDQVEAVMEELLERVQDKIPEKKITRKIELKDTGVNQDYIEKMLDRIAWENGY